MFERLFTRVDASETPFTRRGPADEQQVVR